eukprot:7576378-Pyramimonas_sp.AAC.1
MLLPAAPIIRQDGRALRRDGGMFGMSVISRFVLVSLRPAQGARSFAPFLPTRRSTSTCLLRQPWRLHTRRPGQLTCLIQQQHLHGLPCQRRQTHLSTLASAVDLV